MVSIIMPFYDYWEYLDECIENVESIENDEEFDLIVATDKMETKRKLDEILEDTVVTCTGSRNTAKNLNEAIRFSRSEYLLPFCVDDKLNSKYVRMAETYLNSNPDVDIFAPDCERFGDDEGVWQAEGFTPAIKEHNTVFFSSVVRKSLWARIGGYDEDIPHGTMEDWAFWLKAYNAGAKCFHYSVPMYSYRIHKKQISQNISGDKMADIIAYYKQKGYL
jgi:glycosyltransferase involved in cell wall biosynthesis